MLFQCGFLTGRKRAKFTFERFFSGVSSYMSYNICLTFHNSWTEWTRILSSAKFNGLNLKLMTKIWIENFFLFHFIMRHLYMLFKVGFLIARICTKFTFVWFFSSMNSNMSFDFSGTFHNFWTIWTSIFANSKSNRLNLKIVKNHFISDSLF